MKSIFTTLLLVFAVAARAQISYYVDATLGNNGWPGTRADSAFATIPAAIAAATPGDVIHVAAGNYAAFSLNKRLTISGAGETTVTTGITFAAPLSGSTRAFFKNLRVTGSPTHGVQLNTGFVTLENVEASGNAQYNLAINPATETMVSNVTVRDGRFNGGTHGLYVNDKASVNLLNLTNCTFNDNQYGLYLATAPSSPPSATNVTVRNCTFINNTRVGLYAERLNNATLENLSVFNCGTDPTFNYNAGIMLDLKYQNFSNIVLRHSRIRGSGALGSNSTGNFTLRRPGAVVIKARREGIHASTPASLTTLTLEGNVIEGVVNGLVIGEAGGGAVNSGITLSTVTIQGNHLVNSGTYRRVMLEANSGTLTLFRNYWEGTPVAGSTYQNFSTSSIVPLFNQSQGPYMIRKNGEFMGYNTLSAAVAASSVPNDVIFNLRATSESVSLNKNLTFISPGAGSLHPGSLTTLSGGSFSNNNLRMGSDLAFASLSLGTGLLYPTGFTVVAQGNIAATVAGDANAEVHLEGSGALGTLTFAGGSRTLYRLHVNNGGGVLLGSDLAVALLTCRAGQVATGGNTLTVAAPKAIGASAASYVAGNLGLTVATTNASLTFAVGSSDDFRPPTLFLKQAAATATVYSARVTDADAGPLATVGPPFDAVSPVRYYTLNKGAGAAFTAGMLRLDYRAQNLDDQVFDAANLRVARVVGGAWANLGGVATAGRTGTITTNSFTTLGSNAVFALANAAGGGNFPANATVYVSGSAGSDSNNGFTAGSPKLTVQAAVDAVIAEGTVEVEAGAYNEHVVIDKDMRIFSTGGAAITGSIRLEGADVFALSTGISTDSVDVTNGAFLTDAVALTNAGGKVTAQAGTFAEPELLIDKPLAFYGARRGVAGNDAGRGTGESVWRPATTNLINGRLLAVSAGNVTLDGFTLDGNGQTLQGIKVTDGSNYTFENNVMRGFANAVASTDTLAAILFATSFETSGNAVRRNAVGDLTTATGRNGYGVRAENIFQGQVDSNVFAGVPTAILFNNHFSFSSTVSVAGNSIAADSAGVVLSNILESTLFTLADNDITGARVGYLLFNMGHFLTDTLTIRRGTLAANGVGVAFTNRYNDVDASFPGNRLLMDSVAVVNSALAGIYAFDGAGPVVSLDLTVRHGTITGTGKLSTAAAGIYTFNTSDNVILTVEDCQVTGNRNRGIHLNGGAGSVIRRTTLSGNGFDDFTGSAGYGLVVRENTTNVTVENSTFDNATGTAAANVYVGSNGQATFTSNRFAGNVDHIRTDNALGVDASANWWGTASAADVAGRVGTEVDFTPLLGSDTDASADAGFQGDYTLLYTTTSGTQTSGDRLQEAHDLLAGPGSWTLNAGTDSYAELLEVSKEMTLAGGPTLSGLRVNSGGQTLALAGRLNVADSVVVADGLVNTGADTLFLTTATTLLRETEAAYVTGTVSTTQDLSAVSSSYNADNALGLGLAINQTGAGSSPMGITRITRVTDVPMTGNTLEIAGVPTQYVGLARYFDVEPAVDAGLATEVVYYYREGELNANVDGTLQLFKSPLPYAAEQWEAVPGSVNNEAANTITATLTSFSRLTASGENTPLPVTWGTFTAERRGQAARLYWEVYTEINNDRFEVEQSADAATWRVIGTVAGRGTATQRHAYTFTDGEAAALANGGGFVYYRLRQVDYDGTDSYSPVRYVDVSDAATPTLTVHYRPDGGALRIFSRLPQADATEATLFDARGQVVSRRPLALPVGQHTQEMNLPRLAPGVYLLRVSGRQYYPTRRFVVAR